MGRGFPGLVFLALAAACSPSETPAAPDAVDPATLTPDEALSAEREALARCGQASAEGYCGVRFGMPVDEARRAFPVVLEGYEAREGADVSPDRCYELFAVPPVIGVSFLVEKGVVGRLDILTEAVQTADGFGVGTQASAIRTKFGGAITVATNELEPEITDLAVTLGESKYIFEIQDGVVRSWRAGIAPAVDYVAHCG